MERQLVLKGRYVTRVEGPKQETYVIDEKSLKGLLAYVENIHDVLWKAGMTDVASQIRAHGDGLIVQKKLVWDCVNETGETDAKC